MSKQKRILIVRPDRIGDVVLSTAIPREIKAAYPDAYVAIMVRSYTADIFMNNPYVDELIIADEYLDEANPVYGLAKRIRAYKLTHALMLLPNKRINSILFLAGIGTRVGVGYKFYQFIKGVKSVSRKKYIPLRHEADYCMDLARKIGVETDNINPEIYLSADEKAEAGKRKKELLGGKKHLVAVHTTSGNSAPNWTTKEYAELINRLTENGDIRVVVTDNKVPEEITNMETVRYPNVGLKLRDSIINFAAVDCLVSASTGPMHICAALGVNTVSLFCPLTACSPKLWGPLGNKSEVILPEQGYCQNECPGDPKKCTFTGENGISIEGVYNTVTNMILK